MRLSAASLARAPRVLTLAGPPGRLQILADVDDNVRSQRAWPKKAAPDAESQKGAASVKRAEAPWKVRSLAFVFSRSRPASAWLTLGPSAGHGEQGGG